MTRGDLVESVHEVAVVLLDPAGEVVLAAGAVDAPMLPRSALKPAQAVAVLETGAELDEAGVALASASHSGEPEHLAGVAAVLAAAGLEESDLGCPPDRPLGVDADHAWGAAPPRRLAHNCSGKHAAMLAACRARGWDEAGYLDPEHPLQRRVAEVVTRLAGPLAGTAVDGCGAPALAMSLLGLARLGQGLVLAPPGGAAARVRAAMGAHPRLVAGRDRLDTAVLDALPGAVSKIGAEGVLVAGLPSGHALSIKVLDGAARAVAPVLAALLQRADQEIPTEVAALAVTPVRGGGRSVGHHRVRT